jgi:hypothetical protein
MNLVFADVSRSGRDNPQARRAKLGGQPKHGSCLAATADKGNHGSAPDAQCSGQRNSRSDLAQHRAGL